MKQAYKKIVGEKNREIQLLKKEAKELRDKWLDTVIERNKLMGRKETVDEDNH